MQSGFELLVRAPLRCFEFIRLSLQARLKLLARFRSLAELLGQLFASVF